ncbi:hypothetical protein DACRYDRAFT_117678 [Dacryopinax primogenitus]|uniref:FAD-binding PCMH-type domain-containing protein n=1 Tax=Dacryopinax primogenitus (strain DJM 731) TaxID=1858805 RepID=M5G2L1_DACPD|nr:uncharacterized protein DACRYDRAFT_117678 [Dacryopinax primogenitus]EJU00092.1 hypothetical protein DACRYDRAFT_117678 [Dacryopinax primogenitus]
MAFPVVFLSLFVGLVSALPSGRADLDSCLSSSGASFVTSSSSSWSSAIAAFNLRYTYQPAAVVYPSTSAEASAAVQCAADAGVPVSARSGGHSYAAYGLGGADGFLVVDLSNFNTVSLDTSSGHAIVGTGLRLGESREWGLTLDRMIGAELVLANGTVVSVSADSYPDIFWAIRGSAPSFGVALSYTFSTLTAPETISYFTYAFSAPAAQALLALQTYGENADSKIGMEMVIGSDGWSYTGAYIGSSTDLDTALGPLLNTLPEPSTQSVQELGWLDYLIAVGGSGTLSTSAPDVTDTFYAKSAIVPSTGLLSNADAEAFIDYLNTQGPGSNTNWFVEVELYGGAQSSICQHPEDSTAYGNRQGLLTFQLYASSSNFLPPYPDEGFTFVDGMFNALAQNRTVPLDYYPNYVDDRLTDSQWHSAYYGTNYQRLLTIKQEVDSNGVFAYPQAIGKNVDRYPVATLSIPPATYIFPTASPPSAGISPMYSTGFVYALFDFVASDEDEISFRAGERIDVLDKDDEFADGWWRGRNRAGDVGIFPVNHTSPYKADVPVGLRPATSVRKAGHGSQTPGSNNSNGGRYGRARSAELAEEEGTRSSCPTGHMHARPKLQRANTPSRMSLPTFSSPSASLALPHPRPLTPVTGNGTDTGTLLPMPSPPWVYPHPMASPAISAVSGLHTPLSPGTPKSPSTMTLASLPLSPASSSTTGGVFPSDFIAVPPSPPHAHPPLASPASAGTATPSHPQPMTLPNPIPIPASSPRPMSVQIPLQHPGPLLSPPMGSPFSGVPTPPRLSPALPVTPPHLPPPEPFPLAAEPEHLKTINHPGIPSSWTTDYVVSHLSKRGFDSSVQSAMLAHDISGDVLLSLDLRVMKEELGILAYGKRVRLEKVVGELRRLEERVEEREECVRWEGLREEAGRRSRESAERAPEMHGLDLAAQSAELNRTSLLLPEGPPPYTLGLG